MSQERCNPQILPKTPYKVPIESMISSHKITDILNNNWKQITERADMNMIYFLINPKKTSFLFTLFSLFAIILVRLSIAFVLVIILLSVVRKIVNFIDHCYSIRNEVKIQTYAFCSFSRSFIYLFAFFSSQHHLSTCDWDKPEFVIFSFVQFITHLTAALTVLFELLNYVSLLHPRLCGVWFIALLAWICSVIRCPPPYTFLFFNVTNLDFRNLWLEFSFRGQQLWAQIFLERRRWEQINLCILILHKIVFNMGGCLRGGAGEEWCKEGVRELQEVT
jgi:hypothetical protein